MSGLETVTAAIVIFAGGVVKGVIGFGLPVFTNPLLSLFMAPKDVVVLMSVPVILTNLVNVRLGWREWRNLRHIVPYFAVGIVSVPAGVYFLKWTNPEVVRLFLAAVVFFYLALHQYIPSMDALHLNVRRGIGAACGVVVGFTMGATGITGPVHVMYLSMFSFPKAAFIFLVNAFNSAGSLSLVGSFSLGGEYTVPVLARIGAGLIPLFAGFWVGIRLQKLLPQEVFYRFVRGVLFCIALSLVARSVWNLS